MTEKNDRHGHARPTEAQYEELRQAYRELADDFVAVQTYLAIALMLNGPAVASKAFLEDLSLNDDIKFITEKNAEGGYTISLRT